MVHPPGTAEKIMARAAGATREAAGCTGPRCRGSSRGRRSPSCRTGGRTAGGRETSREEPGRSGEVIDLVEEILRRPNVLPGSRAWKPRAGRIYNFPLRTVPDEK